MKNYETYKEYLFIKNLRFKPNQILCEKMVKPNIIFTFINRTHSLYYH
jgi:hypothetical protein